MFSRFRRPPAPPVLWSPPRVEVTAADVLLIEELLRAAPVCNRNARGDLSGRSMSGLPRALYERIGAATVAADPAEVRVLIDKFEIDEIGTALGCLHRNHAPDAWSQVWQCRHTPHRALIDRGDVLLRRLWVGLGRARAGHRLDQPGPVPVPADVPGLPAGGLR